RGAAGLLPGHGVPHRPLAPRRGRLARGLAGGVLSVRPNSGAGEVRLALLLEGGDAFAVVVGAGGGALGGGLGGQDVVEGQATVGQRRPVRRAMSGFISERMASASSVSGSASLRSRPAQKALPSPRSSRARGGFFSSSSSAERSAARAGSSRALRRSGLLRTS